MDASVPDPGGAVTRQRRRMERVLAELPPEAWASPSRCEGWSVRDVVAHLVTVNQFWESSVGAGRDGTPSTVLASFDPAAHPDLLLASLSALGAHEVLERFVASNDGFLGVVADLTEDEWSLVAESPAGHVGMDCVVDHALWDAWVHERDIVLPLRLSQEVAPDEVEATLRYVAAIGPALRAGSPGAPVGTLAVMATEPDTSFTVEVGSCVVVREGSPPGGPVPCLRGEAVELIDALSLRAPLPADAPGEWRQLLQGLVDAFTKG